MASRTSKEKKNYGTFNVDTESLRVRSQSLASREVGGSMQTLLEISPSEHDQFRPDEPRTERGKKFSGRNDEFRMGRNLFRLIFVPPASRVPCLGRNPSTYESSSGRMTLNSSGPGETAVQVSPGPTELRAIPRSKMVPRGH